MVRIIALAAIVGIAACIIGCPSWDLTPEQQARVSELVKQDAAMTAEIQTLFRRAKAGTISMEECFVEVTKIKQQIDKNLAELEKLKAEGASNGGIFGGILGGLIALFGRSGLHAAKNIPGPIGIFVNLIAPFILGPSGTATKPEPKPATT